LPRVRESQYLYKGSPQISLIIRFQVPGLRVKQWISGRFTSRMAPRNGTSKFVEVVRKGANVGLEILPSTVADFAVRQMWAPQYGSLYCHCLMHTQIDTILCWSYVFLLSLPEWRNG
jgi:hypothetical protein